MRLLPEAERGWREIQRRWRTKESPGKREKPGGIGVSGGELGRLETQGEVKLGQLKVAGEIRRS